MFSHWPQCNIRAIYVFKIYACLEQFELLFYNGSMQYQGNVREIWTGISLNFEKVNILVRKLDEGIHIALSAKMSYKWVVNGHNQTPHTKTWSTTAFVCLPNTISISLCF